jgi:hypothetical protein
MLCFGLWAVPTAAHKSICQSNSLGTHCPTVAVACRENVHVPGTSERQPLTYDGVIEPGASGWADFAAAPERAASTGDVTPETGRGEALDIGRGEPAAIGDIAPDIGLGEALDIGLGETATGGCEPDQEVLATGVNEPDDRGPRGELLKSVASTCATGLRLVWEIMIGQARKRTVCEPGPGVHLESLPVSRNMARKQRG